MTLDPRAVPPLIAMLFVQVLILATMVVLTHVAIRRPKQRGFVIMNTPWIIASLLLGAAWMADTLNLYDFPPEAIGIAGTLVWALIILTLFLYALYILVRGENGR
jgi:hypothetical protein